MASGAAGYVAIKWARGTLKARTGGFLLMQLGAMQEGANTSTTAWCPALARGELTGLTGTLALSVEADGTHRFARSSKW